MIPDFHDAQNFRSRMNCRAAGLRLSALIGPGWNLAALGVLVSLWIFLSGLLVVTRGKPEAFLVTTFGRFCRPDAFEHLNGVSTIFWLIHSSLVLAAIAAARRRRKDVLVVLMIGPVITSAIGMFGQRWDDPNWFEIVAVCEIGWLVSVVAGSLYWIFKPHDLAQYVAPSESAQSPKRNSSERNA
jgi:hypothetical protein